MNQWKNFADITQAISNEESLLKGIDQITPPPSFRIAGQRIPREPHRYSGRTAMNANLHVSEEKPPEDPDSSLSYTMEGFRGLPPPTLTPTQPADYASNGQKSMKVWSGSLTFRGVTAQGKREVQAEVIASGQNAADWWVFESDVLPDLINITF